MEKKLHEHIKTENFESYLLDAEFKVQRYDGNRYVMPVRVKDRLVDGYRDVSLWATEKLEALYKKKKELGEYKEDLVPKEFRPEFCYRMQSALGDEWRKLQKQDMTEEEKREAEVLRKLARLMTAYTKTMGVMDGDTNRIDSWFYYGNEEKPSEFRNCSYNEERSYGIRDKTLLFSDAVIQVACEKYPKFNELALETIKALEVKKERAVVGKRHAAVHGILQSFDNVYDYAKSHPYYEESLQEVFDKSRKEAEKVKDVLNSEFEVPKYMEREFCDRMSTGLRELAKTVHGYGDFKWKDFEQSAEFSYVSGKTDLTQLSRYMDAAKLGLDPQVLGGFCEFFPEFKTMANEVKQELEMKEQKRVDEVEKNMSKEYNYRSEDLSINGNKLEIKELGLSAYIDNKSLPPMRDAVHEKMCSSKEYKERLMDAIIKKLDSDKGLQDKLNTLGNDGGVKRRLYYSDYDYEKESLNRGNDDFTSELLMVEFCRDSLHLPDLAQKVQKEMMQEHQAQNGRPDSLFTVEDIKLKDGKCVVDVSYNFKDNGELVYGVKQTVELPKDFKTAVQLLANMEQRYKTDKMQQESVKESYYNGVVSENGSLQNNVGQVPSYVRNNNSDTVLYQYGEMINYSEKLNKAETRLASHRQKMQQQADRYMGMGKYIDRIFHKHDVESETHRIKLMENEIKDLKKYTNDYAKKISVGDDAMLKMASYLKKVHERNKTGIQETKEVREFMDLSVQPRVQTQQHGVEM